MSELTIFEQGGSELATVKRQSKLADKITSGGGLRRIGTNTNGTFKRIVGGEQIGKAIPSEINVIIIDMLKDVSRTYYATEYDPQGTPTLPDCWSNDGRTPDPKASNKQASACASCDMNVDGSGNKGRGKACRFQRRIAVVAEGDMTGDIYQMNLAAKSLFGKGVSNVHPFESYCTYLKANGEAPDTVVTKVMYDTDADTLTLKFRPVRRLTQEEADLVEALQSSGETERYTKLTVAEADGVIERPAIAAPKQSIFEEEAEEPEVIAAPVKRAAAKPVETVEEDDLSSVLDTWGSKD
jgi:hypothetical protein